jgi:uncharacterized membrane protein YqgA involved in biofilm formation
MTTDALDAISLTGGVLIFCVGWNILWREKKRLFRHRCGSFHAAS